MSDNTPRLVMPQKTLLQGAHYVRGPSILPMYRRQFCSGSSVVYCPERKQFVEAKRESN